MNSLIFADRLRYKNIIGYPEIHIEENVFTFIRGVSGCGKSTLFKLLNATVTPSEGTILYRGKNIREIDTIEYRRKVMLVPQDVFLFDGTIKDNFFMFYSVRNQNCPDDKTIIEFLNTCGALFPLEKRCETLSGGERQRVFLAIFLSFMPDVFLIDEPTSALDECTSKLLLGSIKRFCLSNGITPVAICHSEELIKEFADRIITLDKEESK